MPHTWDYGFVTDFTGREPEGMSAEVREASERETRPTDLTEILTVIDGVRDLYTMQWGLIPNWAAKPPKPPLYNARGETIDQKPSFRRAFASRRGVLCARYYIDFVNRLPVQISHPDGSPVYLAAIWESWTNPINNQVVLSCSMVTIFPNAQIEPIHDRMPVILDPGDIETWITGTPEEAKALIRPWPERLLIVGQEGLFDGFE